MTAGNEVGDWKGVVYSFDKHNRCTAKIVVISDRVSYMIVEIQKKMVVLPLNRHFEDLS